MFRDTVLNCNPRWNRESAVASADIKSESSMEHCVLLSTGKRTVRVRKTRTTSRPRMAKPIIRRTEPGPDAMATNTQIVVLFTYLAQGERHYYCLCFVLWSRWPDDKIMGTISWATEYTHWWRLNLNLIFVTYVKTTADRDLNCRQLYVVRAQLIRQQCI